jgi:hypothetical protein
VVVRLALAVKAAPGQSAPILAAPSSAAAADGATSDETTADKKTPMQMRAAGAVAAGSGIIPAADRGRKTKASRLVHPTQRQATISHQSRRSGNPTSHAPTTPPCSGRLRPAAQHRVPATLRELLKRLKPRHPGIVIYRRRWKWIAGATLKIASPN